jgi:ATP-dependent DNA helicase RecG
MRYVESSIIELKRELTSDLKKEVVAFANSDGGTIYIGINDDGSIVGVSNADNVLLQAINMIRDAIKPDISMFTTYKVESIENKNVIVICVQRGTIRPYYIAEKGLKPSGVSVRQGTATVPASEGAIRHMIKETDGDKYEDVRSLNQELSFKDALVTFNKRNLIFNEVQMKTLGIINSDNMFTNLGLLLSDQCVHTVKVAIFSGSSKSEFKDRREFSGSLLKQLTGVYEYIDIHNKTKAEFSGLDRIDKRDYSEEAIREALLNSLVHRDYSFSGSTLINIYNDRLEFVSIGGLVKGITINDIMLGISQTRNEKLAALFYRLKLIEAYGTGIIKIMDNYKNSINKPELKTADNAFVISLPNMNSPNIVDSNKSNEQIVLDYIKSNNSIARKDVEKLLTVGQTSAGRMLKNMINRGLIKSVGSGKNAKYVLQEC